MPGKEPEPRDTVRRATAPRNRLFSLLNNKLHSAPVSPPRPPVQSGPAGAHRTSKLLQLRSLFTSFSVLFLSALNLDTCVLAIATLCFYWSGFLLFLLPAFSTHPAHNKTHLVLHPAFPTAAGAPPSNRRVPQSSHSAVPRHEKTYLCSFPFVSFRFSVPTLCLAHFLRPRDLCHMRLLRSPPPNQGGRTAYAHRKNIASGDKASPIYPPSSDLDVLKRGSTAAPKPCNLPKSLIVLCAPYIYYT